MNHTEPAALPKAIALSASLPFMLGSVGLAASYGASFFLVDLVRAGGHAVTLAGAVVSTGTVATIATSLVAGRIAEKVGIMTMIVISAAVLALSMLCLSLVNHFVLLAYAGGLLMGIGWSTFYILAPLQVIRHVSGAARIKYLTLVSGLQMLGIGLAAPIGRWAAGWLGSYAEVYLLFALACGLALVLLKISQVQLRDALQIQLPASALNVERALSVLRTPAIFPILMIGLGACIFAGLSTYQLTYAASRHLVPDIFFLTFTATTVTLRFAIAPMIGKFPLYRFAATLFCLTALGLATFYLNTDSNQMYLVAAFIFACGYGLSYSTLNSMVIDLAEQYAVPLSISSQVFTLSYFIGIFGFPYFAGQLIQRFGFDKLLLVMISLVILNGLLLGLLAFQRRRSSPLIASANLALPPWVRA